MPGKPLARWEILNLGVVTSPHTKHFRHLLPVKNSILRGQASTGTKIRNARPENRIKWWNIVARDQVRIVMDKSSRIREVFSVNRLSNRVFMKSEQQDGSEADEDDPSKAKPTRALNVHYSKVQLYLGDYSFPPAPGSDQPRTVPVFALRLGTSGRRYVHGSWEWERFAVATTPRLPDWKLGTKERIPIPWPVRKDPPSADATLYDTPHATVATMTYVPAPVAAALPPPEAARKIEDDYLRVLRREQAYDQTVPMELFLARELSNPHSRAKKSARWHAAQDARHALLHEYVRAELADLRGRTRRAARAEATFKWQERVRADRRATLKKRWIRRGDEARLVQKREKRRQKVERETKRLRELVLHQAPNQVVPEAARL